MSLGEACRAVVMVGNGLFGRSWKEHSEDAEVIDIDTLPDCRNIRNNLLEAGPVDVWVAARWPAAAPAPGPALPLPAPRHGTLRHGRRQGEQ